MQKPSQGYTLIEILIVMVIISIVTTVALLSITHNENKELESVANGLTQMLTLAEEEAMLQPTVLGLSINKGLLQFERYEQNEDIKKNRWLLLQNQALNSAHIPANVEFTLEIGGQAVAEDKNVSHVPQIIFSTNGDLTPFKIFIAKNGSSPRYVIKGDVDGSITTTELS